jgi:hypothetical protein
MRWRFVLACGLAVGLAFAAAPQGAISDADRDSQVVTTTSAVGGTTNISGMTVPEPAVFGTGVISGVVTDGTSGLPLEGVLVQLSGGRPGPAGRPQQLTDARGRFVFTHLVQSSGYSISAAKLGYLDGGYRRLPGLTATTSINLRDGEWLPRADVQLWKTASISGTVFDDQNDPVVGVPVRALMKVRVAGTARYAAGPSTVTDDRGMYRLSGLSTGEYIVHVPSVQVTMPEAPVTPRPPAPSAASSASITSAAPDPDGVLRAEGGLGLYVGFFATPPAGGGAAAYAMAYHPAARSMDTATPVLLAYGDQRQNVDVQLRLLPTVRVSGRVLGPPDALAKMPVRLLPAGSEGLALGAEAALTTTDAQGAFTFLRVPSGDYTLIASRTMSEFGTSTGISNSTLIPRSALSFTSMSISSLSGLSGVSLSSRSTEGDLRLSGRIAVSAGDRDVDDLMVPLVTGVAVTGHYLWDGAEAPPNGVRTESLIRLEPADGDLSLYVRGRTQPRGPNEVMPVPVPFTIAGVLPGRYVFGSVSAGQFVLEAIEWRGRDLLTSPLEVEGDKDVAGVVIRMSSKPTLVTGSVSTATGPATAGAIIAFPPTPSQWRNTGLSAMLFRTGSILADGTFRLPQLVPGEYLVAAIPDEDRTKWTDPDYLASIVGLATRVSVTSGSTVTQSLRMIGGGR